MIWSGEFIEVSCLHVLRVPKLAVEHSAISCGRCMHVFMRALMNSACLMTAVVTLHYLLLALVHSAICGNFDSASSLGMKLCDCKEMATTHVALQASRNDIL
jgi:hypothetical protein